MAFYIFIYYDNSYEKSYFSRKYVFSIVLYEYIGDKKMGLKWVELLQLFLIEQA